MALVDSALSSVISRAAATAANNALRAGSSQDASANASDSFGPASHITLSASAQGAISQGSGNGGNSAAAPSSGGAPVSVPVSSTSDSSDVESLIETAKQQVIPKVGVTGASEVVNNQGTINYVKLNALIAAQNQAKSSQLAQTA